MTTLLKQCFFFLFLIFSNVYAMHPTIDDSIILEDLIENTEFDTARDLQEKDQFANSSSTKPLGIAFQRNRGSIPLYKEGIYRFIITDPRDLKDYSLFFRDVVALKKKNNALLVIDFPKNWTIPATLKTLKITLPAMDTVINGDVKGAQIFIDKANDKNEHRYFFFGEQSEKAMVRMAGQVFAHDFQKFSPMDGEGYYIKELPKNLYRRFIIKNTFSDGTIKTDTSRHTPARHHQISQLLDYAHARLEGVNYFTFEAATGSGKTQTMYYLLSELFNKGQKALIVTSRLNLISQIRNSFQQQIEKKEIVIGSTTDRDFSIENIDGYDILLTTIQGFQLKGKYEKLKSLFDVIIFDEAHNLFSKKRLNIVNEIKNSNSEKRQLLFFTATPTKSERHKSGLLSVYELSEELAQNYIKPYGILQAIDDEVNAPFQIALVKSSAFIKDEITMAGGDFSKKSIAKELMIDAINEVVLDIYQNGQVNEDFLSRKKGIAFCSDIKHAESLKLYLNAKNVDYDSEAIKKYKENVSRYFLSFKPNKLPPEFNDIWRTIYGRVANSLNDANKFDVVIREFSEAFLRRFPYEFADAVHSGNDDFKMSSHDAQARLLRYRLGGTKILCGADKLTEGFDDPQLEIAFFLTPTKSRIKVMQRFGRILRTNPTDEEKIAIGFDFLFHDKQLLISSSSAAGRMSYGLKKPVSITVNKKAKQNYQIATDLIRKGTEKKITIQKSNLIKEKKLLIKDPKKKKVRRATSNVPVENLLNEMKSQTTALKRMADNLKQYILEINTDVDLINILDTPRLHRFSDTNHKQGFDIMPDEADQSIKELKIAMKPILDFFSNSPGNQFWRNFVDFDEQPQVSDQNGLNIYLKNMISHVRGVLNRADRFVTNCQIRGSRNTSKPVGDEEENFNDLYDAAFKELGEEQTNMPKNIVVSKTNTAINSPDNFEGLFDKAWKDLRDEEMLDAALGESLSTLEQFETQSIASDLLLPTTNCELLNELDLKVCREKNNKKRSHKVADAQLIEKQVNDIRRSFRPIQPYYPPIQVIPSDIVSVGSNINDCNQQPILHSFLSNESAPGLPPAEIVVEKSLIFSSLIDLGEESARLLFQTNPPRYIISKDPPPVELLKDQK